MDIAALRGYFLGGSLAEWLKEHDGAAYAERLAQLDPSDPDLNNRLLEVFGVVSCPAAEKEVFRGNTAVCGSPDDSGACGSFGSLSSFSSFGSFGSFGSFSLGSLTYGFSGVFGSFTTGSYSSGSYGSYGSFFSRFLMWEWEWEWRFGGSYTGSFGGSFRRLDFGSYGLYGSYSLYGSYGLYGSYRFGSYLFGSAAYLAGSFKGFGSSGWQGWQGMTPEEYDRIMYECLRRCPLDCFGYGIHIV